MYRVRLSTPVVLTFAAAVLFAAQWAGAQPPETSGSSTTQLAPLQPYLGMRATSATELAARQLGIQAREGAVVLATDVAGPSDEAGLQRGDRIIEFAGKPITNVSDLAAALAAGRIGSAETVIFVRGRERRTVRLVIGGQVPEGVTIPPPSVPPNTSRIDRGPPPTPSSPPEPQAPAGWIERRVGNLIVYVPPEWTPVPFLASDEGCWFLGPNENKTAIFAVIRDVPKDELLAPMTIENERPETLAGRKAVGFFGSTIEQNIKGKGLVVFPTQREADRTLLAVMCFAADEKWSEHQATFRIMLSLVRNRAASP
jgi:hypothetical protein